MGRAVAGGSGARGAGTAAGPMAHFDHLLLAHGGARSQGVRACVCSIAAVFAVPGGSVDTKGRNFRLLLASPSSRISKNLFHRITPGLTRLAGLELGRARRNRAVGR